MRYAGQGGRLIQGARSIEPERDPKKIAEIYRRQIPTEDEQRRKHDHLEAIQERITKARTAPRGIRKSILDIP